MSSLIIKAPALLVATFNLNGTAPYLQARFSKKAMDAMAATQMAGGQKGKKN